MVMVENSRWKQFVAGSYSRDAASRNTHTHVCLPPPRHCLCACAWFCSLLSLSSGTWRQKHPTQSGVTVTECISQFAFVTHTYIYGIMALLT